MSSTDSNENTNVHIQQGLLLDKLAGELPYDNRQFGRCLLVLLRILMSILWLVLLVLSYKSCVRWSFYILTPVWSRKLVCISSIDQ